MAAKKWKLRLLKILIWHSKYQLRISGFKSTSKRHNSSCSVVSSIAIKDIRTTLKLNAFYVPLGIESLPTTHLTHPRLMQFGLGHPHSHS